LLAYSEDHFQGIEKNKDTGAVADIDTHIDMDMDTYTEMDMDADIDMDIGNFNGQFTKSKSIKSIGKLHFQRSCLI
jgi:hypothetical protein